MHFSAVPFLVWVQVDLAREARHLWQFNYNFRHSRHVTFPYPVYPLVSDEVLVETFEVRPDPGRVSMNSCLRYASLRQVADLSSVNAFWRFGLRVYLSCASGVRQT